MEISLEAAYAEACKALGEAHIRERMLAQRLTELEEQNASLVKQVLHPEPTEPDESGDPDHG